MKHDFKKGDLVWWTMDAGTPIPFERGVPFVGIVVNVSERYEGVEVYWFNNNLFKVINYDSLVKATLDNSCE